MEALEKAKLALRKHLLENKKKVSADLEEMRNKSKGKDIFSYVENLSDSFSFESVTSLTEVTYEYEFPEVDLYSYVNEIASYAYSPPEKQCDGTIKKDSEILSESFF